VGANIADNDRIRRKDSTGDSAVDGGGTTRLGNTADESRAIKRTKQETVGRAQ